MARLKAEVASRRRGKLKGLSVLVALALVLSLGIVAVPMAGTVEAATSIYVDGVYGNDANDGETPGAAVKTIKKGIELVDDGGTVHVAAGTCNEGIIVIDKELTIVGDPLDKPVIKPTEDTGADLWATGPTGRGWFQITGGPVEFENLVFDGNGKAIWIAIHYHVGGLGGAVKNCDFKNIEYVQYRGRGIANYGGYVEVLDSTFTNIQRIGVFTGEVAAESLIRGCTYTGKGAGDWLDYAFEVGAGASATIEDNTVTDCYGEGSTWSSAGIYVHEAFGLGTSATIMGNTISGSNYGIVVGYGTYDTSVVVAHYNNIAGNDYGLESIGPQIPLVDATHNWWGAQNGPGGVGPGSGDAVSDDVDYTPWLGAELTETCCETICDCGTMHDTPTGGDVTIDAAGNHSVAVCTYANMPCGTCPFTNEGNYYDVHLEDATNVTSLTVQFCPAHENEVIRYWSGTSWVACSDQVYSDGCIVVTITDETQPSLSDLTGLPFGKGFVIPVGGEAYPVNKASVLAPWIVLAVLLAGGISWLTLRRRRAQS